MAEIKHRWTGDLIATGKTIRGAAESAKANLSFANLIRANFSGANFSGANFREADLSEANLFGCDLSMCDFSMCDLSAADLSEAKLSGCDFSGANLSGCDLSGCDLSGHDVPAIPAIDRTILRAIETKGNELVMDSFHVCETTHCRAGWAIHLAGKAGYALEQRVGPCAAGALIYAVSRPDLPVPDFYASEEDAIEDIRLCATAL